MANEEHVERLKRSVDEWNQWRLQQPSDFRADLSYADLINTNLPQVNLSYADLTCAFFLNANLRYSNLSKADLSYSFLSEVNLNGADLTSALLIGADLGNADLVNAQCNEANFNETDLRGARFHGANLSRASFREAYLIETLFRGANLSGADLSMAHFRFTHLSDADLNEANLSKAQFDHTTFAWINLNNAKGLETAIYNGPSSVDLNSVILPHDDHTRKNFLRGVGFTETQLDYLPSLLAPRPIQYHSLFISYAHQDQTLAERLYTDLRKNDVLCWYAPEDMKIGDKIRHRIDVSIHLYDRLLLILSKYSVASQWVEHEVETALDKEREGQPNVLFPIRLDDAVVESTTGWASHVRLTRHIGDFTNWQDDAAYQRAFSRLLRDLKVTQPPIP